MASLKQITVGTTSYDIIPSAITDSNANYKASCPTISSDTTVEVNSNKTTVINSSSTDTEYPSARAVYTAIQKASKAGTFGSGIRTSDDTHNVPLISTGGMFKINYLSSINVQPGKSMESVVIDGTGAINSMRCAGTIGAILLDKSSGYNTIGHISRILLNTTDTYIGDSSEPTSDTTAGQNGLYGNGTVYISATGASDPSTSSYAFKGSIVNKAGVSDSVKGGYISSIANGSYATIGQIFNAPYSNINEISNQGTISDISNYGGTITKITNSGSISEIVNTGHILTLKMNGSGTAEILVDQGSTADITIRHSMAVPGWEAVINGKSCP
ncbi:hypothetical protein [Intestinibacter sp.]|uniref:hypothetical protein n=1 Tax=Intestinibacter sp. TaxID=1965304 RepID=UPI002A74A982|nr:hypothetical protein [Intestinibacter sp.]MDY2737585.1 hypothetical protein [Intestinibacter sp.]